MLATTTAQNFTAALAQKFADEKYITDWQVTAGRKYDKITNVQGSQTFVHAFVERSTGLLYKAAGWSVPAAGARFDLSDPVEFAATVEAADRFGSYLYR